MERNILILLFFQGVVFLAIIFDQPIRIRGAATIVGQEGQKFGKGHVH